MEIYYIKGPLIQKLGSLEKCKNQKLKLKLKTKNQYKMSYILVKLMALAKLML